MVEVSYNNTLNQTGIELVWDALQMALRDLIDVLPSVFTAVAIIVIYIAVALIVTRLVRKVFTLFKIDELLKPILRHAYFSITNLVLVLINLGIALLAVYSIVLTLFPQQIHVATAAIEYLARVASVIFLVVFVFITLGAMIERIRMEAKMRGFMFLILLFMSIVLIVDITALTQEVKAALTWGISIGIGLSIGVFSAWYFFHEILETKLKETKEEQQQH